MGLKKVLDDIERKSKLEGKLEGKIEGKQEGKQEAKDEIAKRMFDLGLEASVIAAATGFSPEQIEQLQKSD